MSSEKIKAWLLKLGLFGFFFLSKDYFGSLCFGLVSVFLAF